MNPGAPTSPASDCELEVLGVIGALVALAVLGARLWRARHRGSTLVSKTGCTVLGYVGPRTRTPLDMKRFRLGPAAPPRASLRG